MRDEQNNYQFIVDEIADQDLDEFLNVMLDFTRKTGCRFQYRVGKSGKLPLFPCPPKETKNYKINQNLGKKINEKYTFNIRIS